MTEQANQIAALNDEFRVKQSARVPGRMFLTSGVSALPPLTTMSILATVRAFNDFTPDNDPHGEHDFGAFDVAGVGRIFWKIDYYSDSSMQWGSEHPEDPARSFRVLTVMLASEY